MKDLIFILFLFVGPFCLLGLLVVLAIRFKRRSDRLLDREIGLSPLFEKRIGSLYGLAIRITAYEDFFVYAGEFYEYNFIRKITFKRIGNLQAQLVVHSSPPNPALKCITSPHPKLLEKCMRIAVEANGNIEVEKLGLLSMRDIED